MSTALRSSFEGPGLEITVGFSCLITRIIASVIRKIRSISKHYQVQEYKNTLYLFPVTFSRCLLCSPRAGGWQAITIDAIFQRLEIHYAGNADFYTRKDDKIAAWRCFWGAADKVTTSLKCIDAGNANNEKTYLFVVNTETKEGILTLGKQELGVYGWQPPTDPQKE